MDIVPRLCVAIIFLLFMSAFFSGTEMALTSVSGARLEGLALKRPFLSGCVEWASANRYEAISAILIGNNIVNVASSSVATALSTIVLRSHGVAVAVVVMSVLIIIFGEVLPKCVAMAKSEQLLILGLPVVRFFSLAFTPIIWSMERFVACVSRVTGVDLSFNDSYVTREEIGEVIKIGEASGAIESAEREMIDGVISFDGIMVSELMVPRTKMFMLDDGVTVDEALSYIEEKGVSRVPIYTDDADHIIGIVLVKDLLTALSAGKSDAPAKDFMRRALFVPETMFVPKLFKLMQTSRMHMSVVVDEYGGTAGLVTMEDLIEEIVGEIQDEYDREDLPIARQPDGSYRVMADVPLEELNDALDSDFKCEDADSVGGFLIYSFGNFPKQGERIVIDDWEFVISSMGEHMINNVNVRKFADGNVNANGDSDGQSS